MSAEPGAPAVSEFSCESCGYAMNAQECLENPGAVLAAGDLFICLNCGALYKFSDPGIRLVSDQELANWPAGLFSKVMHYREILRRVVTEDLAFNQRLHKP